MSEFESLEHFENDYPGLLSRISKAVTSQDAFGAAFRDVFAYKMATFITEYDACISKCQSPIEKAFYESVFAISGGHGKPAAYEPWKLCKALTDPGSVSPGIYIYPQHTIKSGTKKYIVDFLILTRAGVDPDRFPLVKIVIECDGHDFHERTKEQAAKDRSRDRELQSMGYYVLRFTGSEIHRDAIGCAEQVLNLSDNVWRSK